MEKILHYLWLIQIIELIEDVSLTADPPQAMSLSVPCRGKSDLLSIEQISLLQRDLNDYVIRRLAQGTKLWDFGIYDKTIDSETDDKHAAGTFHDKCAPVITDILMMVDIVKILLRAMPKGEMRDSHVSPILMAILSDHQEANTSKFPNHIFVLM